MAQVNHQYGESQNDINECRNNLMHAVSKANVVGDAAVEGFALGMLAFSLYFHSNPDAALAEEYARRAEVLGEHTNSKRVLDAVAEKKNSPIYNEAKKEEGYDTLQHLKKALELYEKLGNWRDASGKAADCRKRIGQLEEEDVRRQQEEKKLREERERKAKEEREAQERRAQAELEAQRKKKEQTIKLVKIATPIVAAVIMVIVFINAFFIPNGNYRSALNLMKSGEYDKAITAFRALNGFRDSEGKIAECYDAISQEKYDIAMSYLSENRFQEAALEFGKAGNYEDAQERSLALWRGIVKPSVISIGTFTGNNFIVGLKSDGTVVATGRTYEGQCNVSGWNNIISVSAGFEHTVGLKTDGTVVATGSNDYGQCNISNWENIVHVIAGNQCTIGLQSDGSLLFTGFDANGEDECENWEDIVDIWVEGDEAIGKTLDGRIISSKDYFDFSDNDDWKDLKKVSYSYECGVFGLTQDNTVIFDKWSHHPDDEPYYDALGLDDAQYWTDIIDIDGGLRNVVGIKLDGTVVFVGSNEEGQNEISDWRDIAVIATEGRQTIGVKSDGTVLLVGDIGSWGIDVSQWNDIMIP